METETAADGPAREFIAGCIDQKLRRHNAGSKAWSAAFHGSVVTAAGSSAAAGVLAQGAPNLQNWATVFGVVGALVTTVSTTVGFERKWRANRTARVALECLKIDFKTGSGEATELGNQLKSILLLESEGVTGPVTPVVHSGERDQPDHSAVSRQAEPRMPDAAG